MSFRYTVMGLVTLVFIGGLMTAGCGGKDSPTGPTTTPPPTPAPTVSRIEVSPTSASLEVGKTQRFTATAKASNGSTVSGVTIAWSSSNTAVATITNTGVVTAVAAGTATIRATGNGISSAPVTITVTNPRVATVTVSPSAPQQMNVGDMVTFRATAQAAGGIARDDVSIAWSSSDTGVVTIASAGVATAVTVGTATIRASAEGINSSPVMITVSEAPPMIATVKVTPDMESIAEGETLQFEAVAMTSDGTQISGVEFTWSSSDEVVATVDMTGLATGVVSGEVMITATADDVSGSATLTVTEPLVVATVTVSPDSASIEVGNTQQFEAMAMTSDGMEIPDVEFTWSSSDEMVATVDAFGEATAVGAGMAMITATADSVSGSAMLAVMESASRSGTFSGAGGYRTSGTVFLEEDPSGGLVLRFDSDFKVQMSGFYVILYTTTQISLRRPPPEGTFVNLGQVTATTGAQSYTVPMNVALDDYDYVIIYCRPFDVVVGVAELSE